MFFSKQRMLSVLKKMYGKRKRQHLYNTSNVCVKNTCQGILSFLFAPLKNFMKVIGKKLMYRGVQDVGCIMGNHCKVAGNSKVYMETQSYIIFFYIKTFKTFSFQKRVVRLQTCYSKILDTVAVIWHFTFVNMFSPYISCNFVSQFTDNISYFAKYTLII